VGTPSAPRLDERLRRSIAGSPRFETAAAVTREVGELAWELGLPRPSYQAVRLALREARSGASGSLMSQTSPGTIVVKTLDFLYQYPAPGLAASYRRYLHGGL
jgi:hypothetical protein